MLIRRCPEIRRPGCNEATEARSGSTGHKAIMYNSVRADDVNIVDGAPNGEATRDVSSVRRDLIMAALCGHWSQLQRTSATRPLHRMLGQVIRLVGSGVASTSTLARAFQPPLLGFACRRRERPFGPSRIRPCGLTAALRLASRFARLASTFLPGRSAGLRSGLFCGAKRSLRSIRLPRPVGPFACSGRANLPSKHTHMSAEAYPPDGPQISPRQGSQNFSARAEPVARGGPVRKRAQVSGAARGKLLRPASRRLRRP
jgi:hypothetical protein